MKIQIVSDLHLDAWRSNGLPAPFAAGDARPDVDVLVVAGDTSESVTGLGYWLADLGRAHPGLPILVLPGNHEFYGWEVGVYPKIFADTVAAVRSCGRQKKQGNGGAASIQAAFQSALSLQNGADAVPVRFVCCTLWSHIPDRMATDVHRGMRDFQRIHAHNGDPLTIRDYNAMHAQDLAFLEDALGNDFPGKTVVVTHHAPSFLSISPKFAGDRLNSGFATDLERLIRRHQPALWIHGHTHAPVDYRIGRTRVVSNPVGYPGENMARPKCRSFFVEV